MNFRGFLLILAVLFSILRICYVEDPGAGTGPKPSSNGQNSSLKVENEELQVKSNKELADSSSSSSTSSSSLTSSSSSSSSYTTSSSSSLSSSTLSSSSSADAFTESLSTFSSKRSISSSELEQLVVPTVAPATPHFDTETITSSLSVVVSVTETIQQEKKPAEEPVPQHDLSLMSGIDSEEKESCKSEEKGKVADGKAAVKIQESKSDDEKPSKGETESEKPQMDQSVVSESVPSPQVSPEKKDDDSSVNIANDENEEEKETKDKKDEEPKEQKEEQDEKEKKVEDKSKEDESKDKDVDSITAELKQAEEEEETKSASEEMPSFDEFKRQHLQEEEKQKNILKQQQEVKAGTETINKPKPRKIKQRKQNNYASIDCGAKILKANPEASNIFSILQDNRDLYMLNPCSAKIWFIVELCDNVQVKTIEIANFELFSSTPESFRVYVSGRYPTREWTLLGTFQARDERNLQSFPLDEPIYAKYIKVEMLSHFGSEHYCPLSLFRVFGISMMEELEDHEAGGQDDADAVDHDDDTAQVLPPDPSVKEQDKKTQSNILATVGDTLFNMVKVAAKKLTGVIDSEKNLTSDSLGTSTVAPSSSIVSSTTSKEQDAKPSIVTLIPSEDEDDKIHDTKQGNKTTNATIPTDTKKPEGQENAKDNTTFYEKIDPDSSRGSKTTSAFSGCELLVRMLGHSGFGCMMGKVLYSKRKHRGFTPREESPTKQKTSARNVKAPQGSADRTETSTDKGKEDAKKNGEKKEEKESEKVEEKGKKSGKEKVDDTNKAPIEQKELNENGSISKDTDEIKQPESLVETISSSELNKEAIRDEKKQTSIKGAVDPSVMIQPSEVQPVLKPCDPSSEEKGTPVLTTTSVLTTQPSRDITESESTQTTDIEPTFTHFEKSKDEQPESDTRATIDVSKIEPDLKDGVSSDGETQRDSKSESTVSTSQETTAEVPSSKSSTMDQSSPGVTDTCSSAYSFDKSLLKPTQSSSASECKAPSVVAPHKDVDVLEFKILDSAGREGTAHLEKPVEPDKPVQPDEPVIEKEPTKDENSEPTLAKDTVDVTRASPTDDLTVSTSSSSIELATPSVVSKPVPTPPEASEQPTNHPDVNPSESPESISPLPPPPVDKVPVEPPSSIEASISDDLSSVLSKAPSSATAGVPGLASSGAQKESIFMRLTNRIKALEQNLTISTLYMEKLNQKYRKIIEDMQKNFDKKVNLLTNATRKAEAVIKNQKEQISALQTKIDDTSHEMKEFTKQLKSLNIQVMERHIIGLFLEVILIMILFIVFRRWDRARIRRDILRESRMNGIALTSHNHTGDRASLKILNGHLSGREQLQRSFANPIEPEIIGSLSESVETRHKEEYFPAMDPKKKRSRKRPKSGIISIETSQPKTVSESTNQSPPSSLVSATAGLLFNPTRGLLNGFRRSQSLDDCQINQKSSLPSTSRLSKTKSLNVIQESSYQNAFSTSNSKKGRIPTPPPPPPSPQKYWNAGAQPSSSKLIQKKGRGVNGTNPYV